jgi:hypothetical protein
VAALPGNAVTNFLKNPDSVPLADTGKFRHVTQ